MKVSFLQNILLFECVQIEGKATLLKHFIVMHITMRFYLKAASEIYKKKKLHFLSHYVTDSFIKIS